MNKLYTILILLGVLAFAIGCTPQTPAVQESTQQETLQQQEPVETEQAKPEETPEEEPVETEQNEPQPQEVVEESEPEPAPELEVVEEPEEVELSLWQTAQLTDVLTGETFHISDFAGTPVLLETFAVWCPKCTAQQNQIKKLHEEIGDTVVSIALNVDPNEEADVVKKHAEGNMFDWRFVVSPSDVTISLRDDFGTSILNAPLVPKILICPDQSAQQLPGGVKSAADLKQLVETSC